MKNKLFAFISIICLIMFCGVVFVACNKQSDNDKNSEEIFVYTPSTLMSDAFDMLDFCSGDTLIRIKDNAEIQANDCYFDESNAECSKLISECYEFWTHCENYGGNYENVNGSVTQKYTFEYNGNSCAVKYTYLDINRAPTSSAFRIVKKYNISFTENHVAICYENESESFYNEKKYYVDILSTGDGVFIQYYIKTYNGDHFKTYSYDIYKFFYNELNGQYYYISNLIKEGTSTKHISTIELSQFQDFALPEFVYVLA